MQKSISLFVFFNSLLFPIICFADSYLDEGNISNLEYISFYDRETIFNYELTSKNSDIVKYDISVTSDNQNINIIRNEFADQKIKIQFYIDHGIGSFFKITVITRLVKEELLTDIQKNDYFILIEDGILYQLNFREYSILKNINKIIYGEFNPYSNLEEDDQPNEKRGVTYENR